MVSRILEPQLAGPATGRPRQSTAAIAIPSALVPAVILAGFSDAERGVFIQLRINKARRFRSGDHY